MDKVAIVGAAHGGDCLKTWRNPQITPITQTKGKKSLAVTRESLLPYLPNLRNLRNLWIVVSFETASTEGRPYRLISGSSFAAPAPRFFPVLLKFLPLLRRKHFLQTLVGLSADLFKPWL